MTAKFLESAGSKLAEQWVASLLTPAFVFWAGGTVAWLQKFGWALTSSWFKQQPEPLQIALLVAGFCLISASGFVVQRFDLPVLQFLEGYWHPLLCPLRRWFIAREAKRSQQISARWQSLKNLDNQFQQAVGPDPSQFTAAQRDAMINLLHQQHRSPSIRKQWERLTNQELQQRTLHAMAELNDEIVSLDWQQLSFPLHNQILPTRLGNTLRFAEQRPLEKYGLDAVICWPRLWLLLPDSVKKDLQEARAELNTAARVWFWSLLFIMWTIWVWWAAPVGILCAIFAYYYWALDAARNYGELIESTFDLYRHLLYQAIRWYLPADPNEERRVGRELTHYLWRGL